MTTMSPHSAAAGIVWASRLDAYHRSLPPLLDSTALADAVAGRPAVLIKPNLVEALAPPITTPVEIVAVLIDYLLRCDPRIEIIVGEGTGSLAYDTFHCFATLGYLPLQQQARVRLVDLNSEPCRHLADSSCRRWPEMHLPELLFHSFLISVPVLKAHSLARVTLSMKNMMGCAPPAHYQQGGAWGKSSFHRAIDEAIFDLNRYRAPDFTVLDASVGMAEAHLWGPPCTPPVETVAASYDPVAIDAYGAALLQRSWRDVDHIRLADGVLGRAEPLEIREPLPA